MNRKVRREKKFKKIVENKDEFTTYEDIFYGTITGIVLWVLSPIWFPFYWFGWKLPEIVRKNRIVYWREIK